MWPGNRCRIGCTPALFQIIGPRRSEFPALHHLYERNDWKTQGHRARARIPRRRDDDHAIQLRRGTWERRRAGPSFLRVDHRPIVYDRRLLGESRDDRDHPSEPSLALRGPIRSNNSKIQRIYSQGWSGIPQVCYVVAQGNRRAEQI